MSNETTVRLRVILTMKGNSNPIVLNNLKKFDWKHVGSDIRSMEWAYNEDTKGPILMHLDIEQIAMIQIEDMLTEETNAAGI